MKVEENVYLSKLFDAYGVLLSEGQRQIFSRYIEDDLTGSEIAEVLGVSRQAVKDSLRKAEDKLKNMEEKLGFVKKLEALEKENAFLKEKISKKDRR